MTMQRVKQVQGLSFCYGIAPRTISFLLMVWTGGGCDFMAVWAQDMQTQGKQEHSFLAPLLVRERKNTFILPWPGGDRAGWRDNKFICWFSDSLGWEERDSKTSGGVRNGCCDFESPSPRAQNGAMAELLPAAPQCPGPAVCACPGPVPDEVWKEKPCACRSCPPPALVPLGSCDALCWPGGVLAVQ